MVRFTLLCFSLASTGLLPATFAKAQSQLEAGHYFGSFDCGAASRAELISIIDHGDQKAARVRAFPTEGSAYFQWSDVLYQIEPAADGAFRSVRSAFVRQTAGDSSMPPDLELIISKSGGIARAGQGTHCGGALQRIEGVVAGPEAFSEGLRGAITHVSRGTNGFGGGERVSDGLDPALFPIEILSSVDDFGAFVTMRSDAEGRSCLYSLHPMGDMTLERRPVHGFGRCTEGQISFTVRGPVIVLDWGGGYRQPAGLLTAQDQRVAAFLAGLGAAGSQGQSAEASGTSQPSVSLEGVEGEFAAQIQVGLGHYVDYAVTITEAGIRVAAKGRGGCSYVVEPATGDSHVYEANGPDCEAGRFRVLDTSRGLTFTFENWDKPVTLPFVSGDMGDDWIEDVPAVARIKGVTLGDRVPQSPDDLDGYTTFAFRGALGRHHSSSLGMLGVTATNYFDGADYYHAAVPQPLSGGQREISYDDLGIYAVNGRVVAVLRHFEPPKVQAPRYDAVQEALFSTYGMPAITTRSGAGGVFEWHFDPQGALLPAGEGRTCESRLNGDITNSRGLLMLRETVETSLTEVVQGRAPRIEPATVVQMLRVSADCAFSIRYHIHPQQDGLLERMTALMYAHDPVRSEIWLQRAPRLSAEIAEHLDIQMKSRSVAPDL